MSVHTIGVDVGGTKVAAGLVDEAGTILRRTRRPTPSASPDDVEDVIAACVLELSDGVEVEAVGIGAAGFVTADRATVLLAPNLSWRDEPLRDGVAERVGLPVVVENDANAAAWGEYRFGAGRGEEHLVLVTVGTGIGGGIVLDGALHRGRHGIGGEIGHMQMVRDGRRCGCGLRGCWEQYSSGRALLHEAREIAGAQREYGRRLLELGGGALEGIESVEVTQAAREGDPGGARVLRGRRWLARSGHGRPGRRPRPRRLPARRRRVGRRRPAPAARPRGVPRPAHRGRAAGRRRRCGWPSSATTPASSARPTSPARADRPAHPRMGQTAQWSRRAMDP